MNTTVLRALVPVICPPEAVSSADAIVEQVKLSLSVAPAFVQRGFAAGLVAYDLGSLPRYRRRAHRLTGAAAEAYFTSWEHGVTPLQRQFVRAVNQLMSLACYEQPVMTERLGYHPGPWMEEVRHKRLTVFRDEVRRQETSVLAPDPLRPGVVVSARRRRG
jgi:hypothetical protein